MHEDIIFFASKKDNSFSPEMCGMSYCDGNYNIIRPKSQIYVFEYIVEGKGTVIQEDEVFHPQKGDVYILKTGKSHHYFSDSKNPWIKVFLNVSGSIVRHLLDDYELSNTTHIKGFSDGSYLEKIIEISENREISIEEIEEEIAIVLHQFIAKLSKFEGKEKKSQISKNAEILKEYIDRNIEKNISITEMSDLIHFSPSRTINIFKSAYKVTPYEYLLELKITTAKMFLKSTNLSIKEISSRLGFCDSHYFSNFFKKNVGVSPTDYKKSNGS